MTKFTKKDQLNSSWYEIDAKNAVVGRLATVVSNIIRGKNKTTYTPHMDDGDFVVVKNIEQAKFTGKKFQDKKYYRHTGHPGGIKVTTPEKLHEKKPRFFFVKFFWCCNFNSTWMTSVSVIFFILKFFSSKFCLFNIFNNNKVTIIHMRCVCSFVLASYDIGNNSC